MTIRMLIILNGIGIAFIGIWIFFTGVGTSLTEHRLNSRGKTAEVIGLERRSDPGGDKVRLRDDEGHEFDRYMSAPDALVSGFARHDKVTVDYLPDDPVANRLSGARQGGGPIALFGLGMCAAGIYMVRICMRRRD